MKYRGIAKLEYHFEFETDKKTRREIQEEAENEWQKLVELGLDDEKYHDEEVDFEIIG